MSIEFEAGLAIGYKMSRKDFDKVCLTLPSEVEDRIYDDYFIDLDAWTSEGNLILGISYLRADEGTVIPLNRIISNHCEKEMEEIKEFYDEFFKPILGNKEPENYLYGRTY